MVNGYPVPVTANPWDHWAEDEIMSYVPQGANACQSFCTY
jgi:hypothetical protein